MARGRPPRAAGLPIAGRNAARRPRGSDGRAGWCLCTICFHAHSGLPAHAIPLIPQWQARFHCRRMGSRHQRCWCDPRIECLSTVPPPVQPLLSHDGMDVDNGGDEGRFLIGVVDYAVRTFWLKPS